MKPVSQRYFYRDQQPTIKKPRASALKHAVKYGNMTLRFTDEGIHSLTVANWLRTYNIFFLHIPNESKRHRLEAICLKLLGLLPGAADYLIFDSPPNRPDAKGVALEMKSLTGKSTDNQREFRDEIEKRGWIYMCCNGQDEAIKSLMLLGYGYGKRTVGILEPSGSSRLDVMAASGCKASVETK